MRSFSFVILFAAFALSAAEKKELPLTPGGVWRAHDPARPRPPVVVPPEPGKPPSDAVVLFDGKDLSKWKHDPRRDSPPGDDKPKWKIAGGYAEIVPRAGGIRTRETFAGDWHLHVEWAAPAKVDGKGQGRGNSGVFIRGFPEIQVLDSFENDTYPDGQAAGLYSHYPPMVNASRKPGEWQSYDIFFERAKPGQKARLTLLHNGVVVHYLREFDGETQEGDIALQDHINPVRYRNIWLRPLRSDPDQTGTKPPAAASTVKKTTPAPAARRVRIKTLTAQMKYDVDDFTVRPGELVEVALENGDDLPHNIVFCQPGTDTVELSLKQMENLDAALKRDWVPDDKRIWLHSKMLNPHQKETLRFTAPEKAGDYPYVCTFPGHAMTMRGVMKVMPLGEGLKDLRFALYLGAWEKLPDFSKLKPHREGAVEGNLLRLNFDDYKNEYGLVFTGVLHVKRAGSHRFFIAGDDGVRLWIDGVPVVEHDGVHPAEIKEAGLRLEAGARQFRLEYFQKQGHARLFAAWKGANFDVTPLSEWLPKGWEKGAAGKKKTDFAPIPLVVKDEPVIYRNFIAGAGNRGIAVGYPGGVNLVWSAEQMNLALLWRGAFIDASRHWNSRGGGHQPPLGYDAAQPVYGPPLTVLGAPDAAWPAQEERAPGYTWKGYRLDDKRHPVFEYEWNGLRARDRYEAASGKLKRRLTLEGIVPAGVYLRLATGKVTAREDGFLVDGGPLELGKLRFENRCLIQAKGALVAGENLLLPVTAAGEIEVIYSWLQ